METNLFVYNHNTITGYKTKTNSGLLVCKIHHKLSVASSLNSACPQKPDLTHLSMAYVLYKANSLRLGISFH